MKRVFVMVLDSLGIGASPDADKFGDKGANTLMHIAQQCADGLANTAERKGGLKLPNLEKLGLGLVAEKASGQLPANFQKNIDIHSAYTYAQEISSGKDTLSGHWEITGVPILLKWGTFPDECNSFPEELLQRIVKKANISGYLGNCLLSGSEILERFAEQHIETGKPIFYTSSDSVFQIACHEEIYGLEKLYELCQIVREELDDYNIGRVIARPFIGDNISGFVRTGNRKDYAIEPPVKTVLDKLVDEQQGEVIAIGKIADVYAYAGITRKVKATTIEELFDKTLLEVKRAGENTLVFTNFINFDTEFGHHADVANYAAELEYFDRRLPELLKLVTDEDIIILTAANGGDLTVSGKGHTREYVPVLIYGANIPSGFLGKRDTFADIGQTIANYFGLSEMDYGVPIINFNQKEGKNDDSTY